MQFPFHDILSLLFDCILDVSFDFVLSFNCEIENTWYHVHLNKNQSLKMKLVLHYIDWNPYSYFVLKYFHDYQKKLLSCCYLSTCLYTWLSSCVRKWNVVVNKMTRIKHHTSDYLFSQVIYNSNFLAYNLVGMIIPKLSLKV